MDATKLNINVLYVEDNPIDVDLTINHFLFEAPEFNFTTVSTGSGFMKISQETKFDLYLLDHHLPDTLGIELIKKLSALGDHTPVIMVTGLGDEEIVTLALRLGASDYLPKHGDYLNKLPNILLKVFTENQNQQKIKQRIAFDKIKILYIEHNEMDLEQTIEYFKLEAPVIEIIPALNAEDGWEKLKKNTNIDLILCDLRLSGINGVEFQHELKTQNIDLPFVMITGQGDEESALAALKLGAYDFIPKSKNYLEKLPVVLQNAFYRYKLGKANIDVEEKYQDLKDSVDEKISLKTVDLIQEIDQRKESENKLFKSKQLLQDIIDNSPSVIYMCDREGRFMLANSRLEKLFGISRNEIIGFSRQKFMPKNVANLHHENDMLVAKTGKPIIKEELNEEADGTHYYLSQKFPIFNPDGIVEAIGGISTDFTDKKRAEEKLEESEKKYRDLFDSNPVPMWVYDLKTLEFLEVNQTAINNYGYSRDEFLQMTLKDIRPRGEIEKLINDLRNKRQDFQKSGEWKHQYKDGTLIDVEITSHVIEYQNRKASLVMAQDITQRKLIQAELRKSENRYSAFVKQSSDAICLFELEHAPIDTQLPVETQIDLLYEHAVITENNKTFANSHGYSDPDEMKGLKIGQIFPRLAKENLHYLRSFINNNYSTSQIETMELIKDGSVSFFLNSLIGSVEDGKLIRIWGAKQDISRLKKAEQEIRLLNQELEKRVEERTKELLMANKELESFSYSVSHDLRAPLRAISGFTNLIKEDYADKLDNEGNEYLKTVLDNTRRMGELIDDLLRLSRISKQGLNKSLISISDLFKNVFDELTYETKKDKITFTVNPLPEAMVDSSLMKIALTNILSNAIKFSSREKEQVIEVGFLDTNGELSYFVKDNGVGFKMAYVGKLFEVFQRLHRTDEFEGTGIGLAIVKRIIHKHGGKIWAESEIGQGATFYFSIPN